MAGENPQEAKTLAVSGADMTVRPIAFPFCLAFPSVKASCTAPSNQKYCSATLEKLSLLIWTLWLFERLHVTYRLPSLNGLRAFEAAARHLSFKHAATELCVTPGAISQQVKALETAMGVKLFRRLPQGLLLTSDGETYLAPISDAFRQISRATDAVSATLKAREFRLGIASCLGEEIRNIVADLRDAKTQGPVVVVSNADDPELLLQGKLDALLRSPVQTHPRLHLDQIVFRLKDGTVAPTTLIMVPGIKGCREHELLLSAVQNL